MAQSTKNRTKNTGSKASGRAGTAGANSGRGKAAAVKRKTGSAGSRQKKTTSSKSTKNAAAARKAAAKQQAIREKAAREREVRDDITLVVLLIISSFLFLSLLDFGGGVGLVLKDIMFGLFGITSWFVPFCLFAVFFFMITGRGGRKMPVRLFAVFLILLIIGTGDHLHLHSIGKNPLELQFSVRRTFALCAGLHRGGGLAGGALASLLYYAFRLIGSYLILFGLTVIAVMLLLQFSPSAALRERNRRMREEGRPGFAERRAMLRQMRMEERERREEERLERDTERILRRQEEEELNAVREDLPSRSQGKTKTRRKYRSGDASMDLEHTRLDRSPHGTGPSGRASRRRTSSVSGRDHRGSGKSRDIHEIVILPQEGQDAFTIPSGHGGNGSVTHAGHRSGSVLPDPEGTRFLRSDLKDLHSDSLHYDNMDVDTGDSSDLSGAFSGHHEPAVLPGTRSADSSGHERISAFYTPDNPAGNPARAGGLQDGLQDDPLNSQSGDGRTPESDTSDSGHTGPYRAPGQTGSAAGKTNPEQGGSGHDSDLAVFSVSSASAGSRNGQIPEEAGQSESSKDAAREITIHREDKKTAGKARPAGRTARPSSASYKHPPFDLLVSGSGKNNVETERELRETAEKLEDTLRTFGVQVQITDISQGPSVTRYELKPERGVKVSRIVNLSDDIKLRLAATDIRIEAPIPGKSAIGIEVPNKHETTVHLRELMETRDFRSFKGALPFAVGKDIGGKTVLADIARMPHLLIAGATGSGKSVCINTIILSILYSTSPDDVKMLMIDPKVVELSVYKNIPHLIIPVVTDAKKASAALNWAVAEMEKRYKLFAAAGVRDLNGFNSMAQSYVNEDGEPQYDPMPRLIIIVDELADLMMVAKSEVESAICRLAQLARAAGIHLIIATQRPSVDVITGLIKANMPSRIAFAVSSQVDSRTILDMAGAEKLIGRGDMLFSPQYYQKPRRIQGAFVSDDEVSKVVKYITSHNESETHDEEVDRQIKDIQVNGLPGPGGTEIKSDPGRDEYFTEAGKFIIEKNKASIGLLQRVFKIGFNRAARIMDQLAEAGVVSEESSTRARQVLMTMPEFEAFLESENG